MKGRRGEGGNGGRERRLFTYIFTTFFCLPFNHSPEREQPLVFPLSCLPPPPLPPPPPPSSCWPPAPPLSEGSGVRWLRRCRLWKKEEEGGKERGRRCRGVW